MENEGSRENAKSAEGAKKDEKTRINKYLAQAGVCSRREADRLIQQGKVTLNGALASPGQLAGGEDEVIVAGRRIGKKQKTVVLAYYKPIGVTCSERDAHAEKLVTDMIRYPVRVTYAGRLDKDSEGLLLLTNDGDLIRNMMGGAGGHEKEYVVKVDKEITPVFLNEISEGVYLKDLGVKTRACRAEKMGKYTFRIVLTQGVNRQIRRMCKACGYHVRSLKRIRIMHVTLGNLRPGQYVELAPEEIRRLYVSCGMDPKKIF